jgi:hypothetical protein
MRSISGLLAVAVALCAGGAHAENKPLPLEPAPWAALTSPDAAVKVAFEKVCLPAILDGRPVGPIAVANRLLKVDARQAGATSADEAWRLASLGRVFVVAWSDGSCSSSSERGDPEALSRQVLAAVAARGIVLHQGVTGPADGDGRRVAWCSDGPQPLVLAIITRGGHKGRRPALVTTLFKARGESPPFCRGP